MAKTVNFKLIRLTISEISPLLYMTNDCKFRCYVSFIGVSMTSIIVFEFFLLLYGILVNMSVF